jgi:type IV pilus modification protein PilV
MTRAISHRGRFDKQAAFSSLEALAALMVLNLLLMGLLSRQLQAWQAQREALAQQNTVEMAQDLWHRMQVNSEGLAAYQLVLGDKPSPTDCQSKSCSPADWAQADLADWYEALQMRMPGAQARVQTQTSAPPLVRLLLAWPQSSVDGLPESSAVTDCPKLHRCWQTSWPP